jgi:hypothetical protein
MVAQAGLVCELILRAELLELVVWQLPNGRVFADEQEALTELERQRESARAMVVDAWCGLLRLDSELAGVRPTPSRLETVQELVAAGLLPAPVVSPILEARSVTDTVWETIKPLALLLAPRAVPDMGWLITLEGDAADGVELPAGVLSFHGQILDEAPLPAGQLLRAIVHLQSTGWCLQHASLTRPPETADPDPDDPLADLTAAEFWFCAKQT